MKIVSTNPSRNYEILGEVDSATEQDVAEAVKNAREAQPQWAALSQEERNVAIRSFVDICKQDDNYKRISEMMSQEMGKPIREARHQMKDTFDYFDDYMNMAKDALKPQVVFENDTERHTQTREPLGVIACIAPWNFPFLNLPWQCGQALLVGNTVVYKPSEEIALFAQLMQELIEQSSIPKGVFTVLLGDGAVGEMLVGQDVDAVSFTGSTKTGQRIIEIAAKKSTRVLTEMGGSSPGIVFEDADIPKVVDIIYLMRYDNTGQYCDGLKRLIVHESKFNEVVAALKKVNETKRVGDPLDETVDFGPLVAKRQLDVLVDQVKDATDKGASVEFGGKSPEGLEGAYYEPTLLTNVTKDMRVWSEEVFGPVLPIMTFTTEQEAIELANDTIYGLTAYVFTENHERYQEVAGRLQAGSIAHNNALYFSTKTPFGGYKGSGNSRTGGVAGFEEVTQIKIISEEK